MIYDYEHALGVRRKSNENRGEKSEMEYWTLWTSHDSNKANPK